MPNLITFEESPWRIILEFINVIDQVITKFDMIVFSSNITKVDQQKQTRSAPITRVGHSNYHTDIKTGTIGRQSQRK